MNVDKNNKIIRKNHKNIENQINHFITTSKKNRNLPNENIHSNNNSGKPLPDNYNTSRQQSPNRYNYRGNLQIKEIHKISRIIDTVKTINIKITIQDQTQTEVTNQIITETVQTQTPEIDIIQLTVLEISHVIETETIQTTGTENIKITDHETNQTIDQTIIIITIDHVTNLRIKIQIIKSDKEIFLKHRTEIIQNIKIDSKTVEVVHLNIKENLTKYNQLKKLNQTIPVLITQKTQNCN